MSTDWEMVVKVKLRNSLLHSTPEAKQILSRMIDEEGGLLQVIQGWCEEEDLALVSLQPAWPVPGAKACPYCKRPADREGGICHLGGCAGFEDVSMTRLQYDALNQRIAELKRGYDRMFDKAAELERELHGVRAASDAPYCESCKR